MFYAHLVSILSEVVVKRVQFLMSDDKLKALDALVEKTGVGTRTDLINNALTLLGWAVKERTAERSIASVDGNGNIKEVELPALLLIAQPDSDTQSRSEVAQQPAAVRPYSGLMAERLNGMLEQNEQGLHTTETAAVQAARRLAAMRHPVRQRNSRKRPVELLKKKRSPSEGNAPGR